VVKATNYEFLRIYGFRITHRDIVSYITNYDPDSYRDKRMYEWIKLYAIRLSVETTCMASLQKAYGESPIYSIIDQ